MATCFVMRVEIDRALSRVAPELNLSNELLKDLEVSMNEQVRELAIAGGGHITYNLDQMVQDWIELARESLGCMWD